MGVQDSLDNINRQVNEIYSKSLFGFFQKKLGVPGNRGYITFIDPGRENMSYVSKMTVRYPYLRLIVIN